ERLVVALDRGAGELRLHRGELPGELRPAFRCLPRLGARSLLELSRPAQRCAGLLLGQLEGLDRSARGSPALLGPFRVAAQLRRLLRAPGVELRQLGLQLGNALRGYGLALRIGLQLLEPELPLTEGALEISLRERDGLRPGPDSLGGGPCLGEQLRPPAPPLLTGRDPLLD